jgi:hypothetical protein
MPLFDSLWKSPLRKWPQLIVFYMKDLYWYHFLDRFVWGMPREARALEYVVQHAKEGKTRPVPPAVSHRLQ